MPAVDSASTLAREGGRRHPAAVLQQQDEGQQAVGAHPSRMAENYDTRCRDSTAECSS
jgi:hypothetical protein